MSDIGLRGEDFVRCNRGLFVGADSIDADGCKGAPKNALYIGPDGFPVTSLFNRAQGVAYTDRIATFFTGQGVVFTDLLSKEAA